MSLSSNLCFKSTWFLDTSASHHLNTNHTVLINPRAYIGSDMVMLGNGSKITRVSISDNLLHIGSKPLKLGHVFFAPSLIKNLISIKNLCAHNKVITEFYPSYLCVKELNNGKVLLIGGIEHGLYKLSQGVTTLVDSIISPSYYPISIKTVECHNKVVVNSELYIIGWGILTQKL